MYGGGEGRGCCNHMCVGGGREGVLQSHELEIPLRDTVPEEISISSHTRTTPNMVDIAEI